MPPEVWQQIKDDQLDYVIPDSVMSGLPLEMLVTVKPADPDPAHCTYWLDNGPVLTYGPSAAAMLALRRQESDRTQKTYAHQAVLLGDPVLRRSASDPNRLPPPSTGAFVKKIDPGSAAEAIGLQSGAVITAYGPLAIVSSQSFSEAVDKLELMSFHGKLTDTPKIKFWFAGKTFERALPQSAAPGPDDLSDMTPSLAMQLTPKPAIQPVGEVAMRNASLTRYGALTPLPGTREEVKGIYQVLTGQPYEDKSSNDSVVVLLGEDATNQKLEEAAQGTRYLHLATHGLVEAGQNAIYSSLVLSQPAVVTPQDSGLLTLQDLFDHWWGKLDGTELVVLSACDSEGLDEGNLNAMAGEGVFGLPWGFMYAGSPAVVASLWEVQDASTAALMQKFYRDLAVPQTSKLSAFTAARKELKKQYPQPFYWSPFIYLGDPN
jgi:hypothetical protein